MGVRDVLVAGESEWRSVIDLTPADIVHRFKVEVWPIRVDGIIYQLRGKYERGEAS